MLPGLNSSVLTLIVCLFSGKTINSVLFCSVEPKSPTDSSDEEKTSETLSFPPTSLSENNYTLAGELDERPANYVYSRKGRLITKPMRYRD